MSIANSAQLKSFMVKKFDLFKHYKIDSASENYPNYAVQMELEDNYKAEKTDKGAIEVTVYYHDKQFASDMANAIVARIDDINKALLNDNKQKTLSIYTNKIQLKEEIIKTLSDSIIAIKQRFNLFNGIGDLQRITSMSPPQRAEFDRASETYKVLENKKDAAVKELNNTIVLAEQFKATISDEVPTIYLLEKAYPAERKSKPIRWLVILSSVLIAFTITVLTIFLAERYKNIKEALDAE
jgi:capsular polysaccharide biosynthesis protein